MKYLISYAKLSKNSDEWTFDNMVTEKDQSPARWLIWARENRKNISMRIEDRNE